MKLKELNENSKKIKLNSRDMDLIEYAIYGNITKASGDKRD